MLLILLITYYALKELSHRKKNKLKHKHARSTSIATIANFVELRKI